MENMLKHVGNLPPARLCKLENKSSNQPDALTPGPSPNSGRWGQDFSRHRILIGGWMELGGTLTSADER
jgi:hypothetical protein